MKMMPSIVNKQLRNVLLAITALCLLQTCFAELFTAMSDMEELFETEGVLINNLELYVEAQEQKLSYLHR